jgi:L-fucose mutarotase
MASKDRHLGRPWKGSLVIYGSVVHPDVLAAITRAGHSAKVLITDGHFPAATLLASTVPTVFLNYAPDLLGVAQILRPLVETLPIESAIGATFEDGSKPPIWREYEEILPAGTPLSTVKGSELGALINTPGLALAIISGEMRAASCIVLTMGIRPSS